MKDEFMQHSHQLNPYTTNTTQPPKNCENGLTSLLKLCNMGSRHFGNSTLSVMVCSGQFGNTFSLPKWHKSLFWRKKKNQNFCFLFFFWFNTRLLGRQKYFWKFVFIYFFYFNLAKLLDPWHSVVGHYFPRLTKNT